MKQLFGFPVVEFDGLNEGTIIFALPEDCYVIYSVNDKSYYGNYEIYTDKRKMWIVDKRTGKHLNFYSVDIEMARKLRATFDESDKV